MKCGFPKRDQKPLEGFTVEQEEGQSHDLIYLFGFLWLLCGQTWSAGVPEETGDWVGGVTDGTAKPQHMVAWLETEGTEKRG